MKKIVKLTESDLNRIVKRVLSESQGDSIVGNFDKLDLVRDTPDGVKIYGKQYPRYVIMVLVADHTLKSGKTIQIAKILLELKLKEGKKVIITTEEESGNNNGWVRIEGLTDGNLVNRLIPAAFNLARFKINWDEAQPLR